MASSSIYFVWVRHVLFSCIARDLRESAKNAINSAKRDPAAEFLAA